MKGDSNIRMKQIYPSLIARNQKEFDKRYEKISKLSSTFHLDVMDGKFVKNKSLYFELEIPKNNYQVHLMIKNPEEWIKENSKFAKTIIFHIESTKNPESIIKLIKSKKKKIGIAINPRTSVSKMKDIIKQADSVLIMTVNPGKYGAKFLPNNLKKIKEIKKINPRIKVGVDGGISDKTIKKASKAEADFFTIGSYLQKSDNPKESIKKLKKII